MAANQETTMKLRVFELVISSLLAAVGAVLTWTTVQVVEHKEQIAVMKSSVLNTADGMTIYQAIHEIGNRLPKEFPPSDYQKMIDGRFTSVERRMAQVEDGIINISKILTENRVDIQAIRMAVETHKSNTKTP